MATAEAPFTVADIATSDLEVYDTLAGVHGLLVTLTGNPTLVEFGFAVRWPELKPEEKRERYSRYACHELNFFLYHKDPKFFEEVVKPFLRNKKDPTFLDRWLLGEKLDEYLRPGAYLRLNALERILLAQRIPGEAPFTERHLRDLLDLVPPEIEREDRLFQTALKGRALETGDVLGLERARKEAKLVLEGKPEGEPPMKGAEGLAATPAPAAPATAVPTRRARMAEKAREAGKNAPAEAEEEEAPAADEDKKDLADRAALGKDLERRRSVRQLFRRLESTQEWVENNYYQIPLEAQDSSLITVNPFWMDYAAHPGGKPFFSVRLAEASRNFTEMMMALAVLDLPFTAGKHRTDTAGARLTLRPDSPLIVYHKTIQEAAPPEEKSAILVTQHLYRHGDRYLQVGSEKVDKFIADELLAGVVYGCQVVITNPASSARKLDVLLQVPAGALPVQKGQYTRSFHLNLEPYHTWTTDYFFYFPTPGTYAHFPVHVSKDGKLIAFAPPMALKVVAKLSAVDTNSWDYLSQNGDGAQVLEFLEARNLGNVRLERIAWRMKDRGFFEKAIALLIRRHVYDDTLWSYGLLHDAVPAIREYLQHAEAFVARCGKAIESPLLTIDPVERKAYQHREYRPLVNARVHQLGKSRQILNDRFYEQYQALLEILCYRGALDDDDRMSLTYYLLLQDRIEEALRYFDRVDPAKLATRIQHDYFRSYLAMYSAEPGRARDTAATYASYPVNRWRDLFSSVLNQLDELEGKAPAVIDQEDRGQAQARLAATEPGFELELEGRKVTLRYQNLAEVQVRYYLMDIELLFSRSPFVAEYSSQFAYIQPNAAEKLALDPQAREASLQIPERIASANVLIEVEGAGAKKARTYFSSAMAVQVVENYAQARVTQARTGKPLPEVYVKAYARMKDGGVRFYKDGYTDLRGRFDYGSLSTNEIENVEKFALLFLSEDQGAMVREVGPPKE